MSLSKGQLADKVRGALWGVFIGDALSMPVHWYYDIEALKRDFGTVEGYEAPKEVHPNSYMRLESSGPGPNINDVVGKVILHGKRDKWVPDAHYHSGLAAGENTLNALCTRVVVRGMAEAGGYDPKAFLSDYVKFLTTPGSHNDAYADSSVRELFTNWAAGVPAEKCTEGTEAPHTAAISGLVMLPPVVLGSLGKGREAAGQAAAEHVLLTYESKKLAGTAEAFSNLLADVAEGADLKEAAAKAGSAVGADLGEVAASGLSDTEAVHKKFGPSCGIDSSLPAVLYLAFKHAGSFEDAVLANTNAGGDNTNRGAVLGALMGAAVGEKGIPARLIEGLKDKAAIRAEIDAFVARLVA